MDIKNLSIIRQTYANTVFTHKVQEVAAEVQKKNDLYIKLTNILLVSIVLILLFLQTAYPQKNFISYIGAGVTISEVIFLIIQLTFSFEQKAIMHKNSALKYMELRDRYKSLIADIMSEAIDKEIIINRRDLLLHEYQIISDLSPNTSNREYVEAQKKLNKKGVVKGEEFTWSDEEIDHFLPEKLQLKI